MINKIKNFLLKKENVVKCAYCTATVFSSVAFGLLFAKLIGGDEDIELGNAFDHAFRGGTYNILLMVALLLVIATLTWNVVSTIMLFIPKTKNYMLSTSENDENSKLYAIIHLSIFGVLALYACLVFFLSRIIIMQAVDNGILPAAGFLGVFALLAICTTGVANCINEYSLFLPKSLEPKEVKKEEKKEEAKKEVKKVEEKKKEEPKVEEKKKEEPKVEKKEVVKKEEPKKVEVKEEEEPEEKAVSLKEILKTAAVKKRPPKKPKPEKKEPKEGEKEVVDIVIDEPEEEEVFDKELMSKTMKESFPKLIYEGRENYTSTGLPLADTCYIKTSKGKKCFMYVYETEGSSLILCKISKEYYRKLKAKKDLTVTKSEFPKSTVTWSSVVLDTNVNRELVLEIIKEASEFVKVEAETNPNISDTLKPASKPTSKPTPKAEKKPGTKSAPAKKPQTGAKGNKKPASKK